MSALPRPEDGEAGELRILLTNDDGIYAPGLAALEQELRQIGEVVLVAPATEQSGVGHSITFLNPLICKNIFSAERHRGWAVEGSPADCVKIGVFEFCEQPPDLVVSGINGGLNAGINVLYSGTVAAAIEGAFFGITSIAVSLEENEHARFGEAARIARRVIERILAQDLKSPQLYNLNIPTAATEHDGDGPINRRAVRIVPMGVARYGEHFLKRQDPKGRVYYWATSDPPPKHSGEETDLSALADGYVTLTPLDFNMTKKPLLDEMRHWGLCF